MDGNAWIDILAPGVTALSAARSFQWHSVIAKKICDETLALR
jgi:hypothetical protein